MADEDRVDLLFLVQLLLQELERNKHRANDALLRLQRELAQDVAPLYIVMVEPDRFARIVFSSV